MALATRPDTAQPCLQIDDLIDQASAALEEDTGAARAFFIQALALADALDAPEHRAVVLRGIGNTYLYDGDLTRAQEYLEQALLIAQTHQDRQGECLTRHRLGQLESRQGDWAAAVASLQSALRLEEDLGTRASILSDLGRVYTRMGKTTGARDAFDDAAEAARGAGDPRVLADVLGRHADLEAGIDEIERAIPLYLEAIGQLRGIRRPAALAALLSRVSVVFGEAGDVQRALACIDDSMAIDREIGRTRGLVDGYLRRALLLEQAGRYEEAIEANEIVLAETDSERVGAQYEAWSRIGRLLGVQGRFEEAFEAQAKALELGPVVHEREQQRRVRAMAARYETEIRRLQSEDLANANHSLQVAWQEIKSLRESLDTERTRAQEAVDSRRLLLQVLGQEVHTNLSAVMSVEGLLLRTDLSEEVRRGIGQVVDAGEVTLTSIGNVLDYYRLADDQMVFRPMSVDTRIAVGSALTLLAERAAERSLRYELCFRRGIPQRLTIDEMRLRQILTNLVDNALQHAGKRVRIDVGVHREGELRIWVRDDGAGIDPAVKEQLFAPSSSGAIRATRGAGLGLAVCRQIVEKMGGRIGVDSRVGTGSIFWFSLPFNTQHVARVLQHTQHEFTSGGRAPSPFRGVTATQAPPAQAIGRVLLVDNDKVGRAVGRRQLQRLGVTVEVATESEDALRRMREQPFDLVLIQHDMPGMDGLQAIRTLRGGPGRNCRVPVVALTATDHWSERRACQAAGMDDFMAKPVTLQALDECLKHWLGGRAF